MDLITNKLYRKNIESDGKMNNCATRDINFLIEQQVRIFNGLWLLNSDISFEIIEIDPNFGPFKGMFPFGHTSIMAEIGIVHMCDNRVHFIDTSLRILSGF